jgi:hypothetical protein
MSSYFKDSEYTAWQKETQWLNLCVQSHDLMCWCNNPWNHLLQSLLQRGSQFNLSKKSQRIIQKCLTTTAENGTDPTPEEDTTDTKEETGFDLDAGDLEKLFQLSEDIG